MEIFKFETNYKRNMLFSKSIIKPKTYSEKLEKQIIQIYPNIKYQEFLGFGGAFTEASGYTYSLLDKNKRESLIKDYFSEEGLNYNFGRLPIGSSDFSLKSYSYSNKIDLSDFNIEKDKNYIIPLVNSAKEIKQNITFLASPWSPPKFMKSNKMLVFGGKLADKYKQNYADYLSKYILAYQELGINIKYITAQNEPNATQIWESCIYSPKEEADFIIKYLYPTFQKNDINTKILIWDHNKEKVFSRALEELNNKEALNDISGIAFHWYTGDHFENINLVSETFPGKILIHTEGCTGYSNFAQDDEVKNGEIYAHDILGDLNAGTNAYIDWNLILDYRGGPNHKANFCNSPIMLNQDNTNYIKNLTYYYIKHFSHFIKTGSKRIAYSKYTDRIGVTSFLNPDNSIIIVLLNRNGFNKEYNLCINDILIHDNLDAHAIVTYQIK
jgi:glucosylceramidase